VVRLDAASVVTVMMVVVAAIAMGYSSERHSVEPMSLQMG
jgi:hypothetical protein